MVLKKIWWLLLFSFACNNAPEASVKPVVPDTDEPKQYGIPFASVADPQQVVLYEVNLRAFSDSGNFQGVIDKLDHIKSLGVNTIWLMPIHPVGQVRSAGGLGSPYSVQNYLEVNSEYGNLETFRSLVQQAHDRNMAVIIDWVANHTSWDNPWMEKKSWYTLDASGNPIIPPGTNWQDVAELNYDNYDMRKAMIHAMKYWVLEANIDGFRCDAVDYVPSDFWKQALDELKSIEGRKLILLAEGGKQENFSAGFQMNYGWDFCSQLGKIYKEGKAASTIFTTHQEEYDKIPDGAIKLRYTTNHDLSAWEATPIEVFGGREAALSASVITLFISAAPLIYGSQEVGRAEKLAFFTRDPIAWDDHADMLEGYKTLMNIYNSTHAFSKGAIETFPDDNITAFQRTFEDETYLVLVNVRGTTQQIALPSLHNTAWTDLVTDESLTLAETMSLPAFGYRVLKKQ